MFLDVLLDVYNALTIHGLAECDVLPQSVLNVQLFWKMTAYNIAGHVFSLDDIEHGILRGKMFFQSICFMSLLQGCQSEPAVAMRWLLGGYVLAARGKLIRN